MKIRQRGEKVVYQPQSTLYHLESQTPGRKDHDQANGTRLLERWGRSWWRIGDEDAILVPEGLAARTVDGDSKILTPITDAAERRRWEAVRRLQHALLTDEAPEARRLLAEWGDWPDDVGVRRWIERARRDVGLTSAGGAATDVAAPA